MKTAEEWDREGKCYATTARRIQADALRWALEQVVPDGNPENVSAKIRAKLNELEQ